MDSFKEFVEYVVTYRLAGHYLLDVLNLYIRHNYRPTDISYELKVNKYLVRNSLCGVRRIAGNWIRCGKYFNSVYDLVIGIKPIVYGNYCTVCGKRVRDGVVHVRSQHHDLVDGFVGKVLGYACSHV